MPKRGDLYECAQKVNQQKAFKKRDEHLYSPRMVGEIKEKKPIGTSNRQTVI